MSQHLDLAFIRDTYEKMSDSEIIHVATQNASGMSAEAQKIIKEEIKKRKLSPELFHGVQAQNREFTAKEIEHYYSSLIRHLSCPDCGCSCRKLNGTIICRTISFIVYTSRETRFKIACPSCLDKANTKAQIVTLLFGWWGFPWGVIRTIQSVVDNLKLRKSHHLELSNDALLLFTLENVGLIEAYKGDTKKLQAVITGNS